MIRIVGKRNPCGSLCLSESKTIIKDIYTFHVNYFWQNWQIVNKHAKVILNYTIRSEETITKIEYIEEPTQELC